MRFECLMLCLCLCFFAVAQENMAENTANSKPLVELQYGEDWTVFHRFQCIPNNQLNKPFIYFQGRLEVNEESKYVMYKFNSQTLKAEDSILYDLEIFKNGWGTPFNQKVLGNRIIQLFSGFTKEGRSQSLLKLEFDANSLRRSGFTNAYEVDSKKQWHNVVRAKWSVNDSLILAFVSLKTPADQNEKVAVCLMNANFDRLFEATIDFEKKSKDLTMEDLVVLNDGSVYLSGSKRIRGQQKKDDVVEKRELFLYKLDTRTQDLQEYDLGLQEYRVYQLDLTTDEYGNDLIISGLYDGIAGRVGTFFGMIKKQENALAELSIHPFPVDHFDVAYAYNRKKTPKKLEKRGLNMYLAFKGVYNMSNQSYTVLYEEKYTIDPNGPSTFVAGPIIYMNYKANGQLNYSGIITKNLRQYSHTASNIQGAAVIKRGDALHLIYNDDKGTFVVKDSTKRPGVFNRSYEWFLTMYTIQLSGETSEVALDKFRLEPINRFFFTEYLQPISDKNDEFFLPLGISPQYKTKLNGLKLAKLKFLD